MLSVIKAIFEPKFNLFDTCSIGTLSCIITSKSHWTAEDAWLVFFGVMMGVAFSYLMEKKCGFSQ